MSKLTTRVVLSALISLGVIVGIYTTVLGASPWGNKTGSHLVSGAKVNLDHYRSAESRQGVADSQGDFIAPGGQGHGCESESQINPNDL